MSASSSAKPTSLSDLAGSETSVVSRPAASIDGERDVLDVRADPEAEIVLQAALAVDVEPELERSSAASAAPPVTLQLDAQRLRELRAGVDAHVLDRERQELDVLRGAEAAGDAVDRHRADLGVPRDERASRAPRWGAA